MLESRDQTGYNLSDKSKFSLKNKSNLNFSFQIGINNALIEKKIEKEDRHAYRRKSEVEMMMPIDKENRLETVW